MRVLCMLGCTKPIIRRSFPTLRIPDCLEWRSAENRAKKLLGQGRLEREDPGYCNKFNGCYLCDSSMIVWLGVCSFSWVIVFFKLLHTIRKGWSCPEKRFGILQHDITGPIYMAGIDSGRFTASCCGLHHESKNTYCVGKDCLACSLVSWENLGSRKVGPLACLMMIRAGRKPYTLLFTCKGNDQPSPTVCCVSLCGSRKSKVQIRGTTTGEFERPARPSHNIRIMTY